MQQICGWSLKEISFKNTLHDHFVHSHSLVQPAAVEVENEAWKLGTGIALNGIKPYPGHEKTPKALSFLWLKSQVYNVKVLFKGDGKVI